jgi:hypothetical protein
MGDPTDDTMEPKAAKIVRHGAGAVGCGVATE